MIEIEYWKLFGVITILWVVWRALVGIKNRKISFLIEAKMLMVYICIVVVARLVYFPAHHINGKIGTMKFDASKILPVQANLVPIIHMFDSYDGWLLNIIGNIGMFVPVGIVWPICFKKINTIGKTILVGALFSLLIEVSQLFLFERYSDIDDIILNTSGAAIGALIYFGCKKLRKERM